MKQVIARAGKVVVVDVPAPICGEHDVLVRTASSVISTGTETWSIDATDPISASELVRDSSRAKKAISLTREVVRQEGVRGLIDYVDMVRNPEVPLGYSSSGVVVKVGGMVSDILVGDSVACAGEGKACHAEVASVPRNLLTKIPDGVEMEDAAFSTIGAIAVHAFRRGGAHVGDTVGVIGAGLVGNLVAQIACASACRVVSIDLRDDRLSLAREVGVDLQLRPDDPALLQHVSHFTNGRGLDVVFVCAATSGSEPINLGATLARNRAKIVVVGRVGMDIDRNFFYKKELELVMSRSLGPGRYDPIYEERGVDYPIEYVRWTLNRNMEAFLELVRSRRISVKPLVGAHFPVSEAPEAYESLGQQSKVAVLLSYGQGSEPRGAAESPELHPRPAKARSGNASAIRVALVGPGNFAKEMLIPLLRRSESFTLRWVVSSNPTHATQLQRRYAFERSTCDYSDVLNDPETDLVVISTPNNLHAPMVLRAMEAGKAVFAEKPLCLTRAELEEIKKKVRAGPSVPLVVGFNRRYSPLVLKLKERMAKTDGPFVLLYRVNAGFIPTSRWVQDPQVGGGRVIAECCHFFDLFNFLLGRKDPEILVQSAGVSGSTSVTRDNVSVTLKYSDGSIASLVYTAMGDKSQDRERLEVYGQGTSMVIDDFKELTIYGNPPLEVKVERQDKGHEREFEELSNLLLPSGSMKQSSSVITPDEIFSATELTFQVEERLRNAGADQQTTGKTDAKTTVSGSMQ